MREIQALGPREVLGSVENQFDMLKDIKLESGSGPYHSSNFTLASSRNLLCYPLGNSP